MSCVDFTSDDYGMVLEGAVESLPGMLHNLKYEDCKQDVSLVFKYLEDCCALSRHSENQSTIDSVLTRIVSYETEPFVQSLSEYHRMCVDCSDVEYLNQCVSIIMNILENVIFQGKN